MARVKNVYCAFCRSSRRIYTSRGVGAVHLVGGLIWSVIFTMGYFREMDFRGVFVFLVTLGVSEIFLRLRWRMQIVCPHCGFDPVLYLKNPEQAAAHVRVFLERRQASPDFLLAPRLNLPAYTPAEGENNTMDHLLLRGP
ncbi:MAG: hypothetical protein IPK04_10920 [Bdellovibrionales bacterium]|nr:hypothetical protein [Bdellovibrionales bacterium]